MINILEIWGNGTEVIIKFTRDVGGIWWAASKWMTVSYPYTLQFLKANGYRKLNYKVHVREEG